MRGVSLEITQGEWYIGHPGKAGGIAVDCDMEILGRKHPTFRWIAPPHESDDDLDDANKADWQFIAVAREAMPRLIAALREARERLKDDCPRCRPLTLLDPDKDLDLDEDMEKK